MLVYGVLSHGPMSDSYLLQRPECSWMLVDAVFSHGAMSVSHGCSAQDASGCSWMGCSPMDPCAVHRMLVDARGWRALPCTHERFLPVQRAGCSWLLVEGMLSQGPMSDLCLCSAQDARGCSWMGCSPMDPCAEHMMLVYARGWGALPWGHQRSLPVQRAGCSWMLVGGVLSHGAISLSYDCSAQDAREGLWVGCSPMGP